YTATTEIYTLSLHDALPILGAQRIQHGVRAAEDPELLRRLADSDVCLDVCPTSNVQLRVVESLATHPLPALLDAGVNVSLNADRSEEHTSELQSLAYLVCRL